MPEDLTNPAPPDTRPLYRLIRKTRLLLRSTWVLTGLGLTLAQTFVQQHHGLIECDSVPGRTDFKILVPLP